MPSWKRDGDRALEDELRAARPEPRLEVTRSIADRVRPRDSAGKRRFGRLQLAVAGGLTALVLTPVVATGFGGLGTFGKSSKAGTSSSASALLKSRAGSGKALMTVKKAASRRGTVSSRRATGRRASAAIAPTGNASGFLDSPSSFLESVFQPQNDLAATNAQYQVICGDIAVIQDNDASITQGGNTATGGAATATGGAGGDASTGNTQVTNGTAVVDANGENVQVFGGDTSATSGAATGGAGGNATATGGDAFAGNFAEQTVVNNATICP